MKLTKLESIRDDLNRALYELDKSDKKYMDVDEIEFSFDVREFEALGLDADYIQLVFNHTDSWAHA